MLTIDPFGGSKAMAINETLSEQEAEQARRLMAAEINGHPRTRDVLQLEYGKVWDTEEVAAEFEVREFAAPFVIVMRKSDGQLGTLLFQHDPKLRYYFCFIPDRRD